MSHLNGCSPLERSQPSKSRARSWTYFRINAIRWQMSKSTSIVTKIFYIPAFIAEGTDNVKSLEQEFMKVLTALETLVDGHLPAWLFPVSLLRNIMTEMYLFISKNFGRTLWLTQSDPRYYFNTADCSYIRINETSYHHNRLPTDIVQAAVRVVSNDTITSTNLRKLRSHYIATRHTVNCCDILRSTVFLSINECASPVTSQSRRSCTNHS